MIRNLNEQFIPYTSAVPQVDSSICLRESDFFEYISKQFVKWSCNQQQLFLDQLLLKCSDGELQALASALELVFHHEFGAKLFGHYPVLFLRKESTHHRHTRKSIKKKNSEEERLAKLFDNDIHFPLLSPPDKHSNDEAALAKEPSHAPKGRQMRRVKSRTSLDETVIKKQSSHNKASAGRDNKGDNNKSNHQDLEVALLRADSLIDKKSIHNQYDNENTNGKSSNDINEKDALNEEVLRSFSRQSIKDFALGATHVNKNDNIVDETVKKTEITNDSNNNNLSKHVQLEKESDALRSFANHFVRGIVENAVKQLVDNKLQLNKTTKSRDIPRVLLNRTRLLPSSSQHALLSDVGKSENFLRTPRNTATLHHNPWRSHAAYPWTGRDFRALKSRRTSSETVSSPQATQLPHLCDGETYGYTSQSTQISNQALQTIFKRLDSQSNRRECAILCQLLKLCDSSTIDFVANRLYQRFKSLININWLADDMLIKIFANLDEKDITSCAQVCRRWRQLCYTDELWILKCHILASKFRLQDVEKLLMKHLQEAVIDWRLAYKELPSIIVHHVTEREKTKLKKSNKEQVKASVLARMSYRLKSGLSTDLDPGTEAGLSQSPVVRVTMTRMTSSPISVSSSTDDVTLPSPVKRWDSDLTSASPKKSGVTSTVTVFRATASYKLSLHLADGTPLSVPPSASQEHQQNTQVTAPTADNEIAASDTDQKDGSKEVTQQTIIRNAEVANDIRVNLKQPFDLLGRYSSNQRPMWSRLSENRLVRRKPLTQRQKQRKFAGYVPNLQRVLTLKGHTGSVLCIQTDKKRVFSGGRDHFIVLWDVRSGNKVRELVAHKGSVSCLLLDGNTLYSGSWDMTVLVWDTVSLSVVQQLSGHLGSVTSLHATLQYLLSASHDGTARVWNKLTNKQHGILGPIGCHVLGVYGDVENAVTLSADRCIRIYSLETCKCHQMINTELLSAARLFVCGNLLAVADHRGIVKFWSGVSGAAQAAIQAHDEPITALTIHKGRFYTASSDKTIREWDLSTLTCIRHLQGHTDAITDIQVTDTRIVSCSVDGEVRVWDFVSHPQQQSQELRQTVAVGNSRPYLLPCLVDLRDEQPKMEGEDDEEERQ